MFSCDAEERRKHSFLKKIFFSITQRTSQGDKRYHLELHAQAHLSQELAKFLTSLQSTQMFAIL